MSGRQWRSLAERLGSKHRVLTPDLLGSGANPPWPADRPFHFREDVAELAKLIAAQDEPVHLVGHSYGGFLVLQLVLDEATRARVRSVAVYDPVTFGVLGQLPASNIQFDDATGGDEAWFRGFVGYWNGPGAWDALPPPSRAQFMKIGRKVYFEVKTLLADPTPASAWASFSEPALVMNGERTPPDAQRIGELLAGALPNARRILVENAGHMGPLTHATVVNDAIASHLEQ
jgi:pimeloyl-ACP methyl ester carboxylesterase